MKRCIGTPGTKPDRSVDVRPVGRIVLSGGTTLGSVRPTREAAGRADGSKTARPAEPHVRARALASRSGPPLHPEEPTAYRARGGSNP